MAFDWSSIDIGVGDPIEKDDVALMKKNAEDLRDEFGVSWTWDHFVDCDSETDDGYPLDNTIKSEQPTELQNKIDTLDDAKFYSDKGTYEGTDKGTNNDDDQTGHDSTVYSGNNDDDQSGHESTDYGTNNSDDQSGHESTNYGTNNDDDQVGHESTDYGDNLNPENMINYTSDQSDNDTV